MGKNPRSRKPRQPARALSAHQAGKLASHKKPTYDPDAPAGPAEHLTEGEMDVITLVAENLSDPEISQKRGTKIATVQKHIENAYKKLKVNTRAGAAIWLLTRRNEALQREVAMLKEMLAKKEE